MFETIVINWSYAFCFLHFQSFKMKSNGLQSYHFYLACSFVGRCKHIPSLMCAWSRRILVATHLFILDPHHCFFQFYSFLNYSTIYYFWKFSGPKLLELFWGPKRRFFCIKWSGENESILNSIFVIYGCSPWIDLSNDVSCTPNGGSMPKLRPREIYVPSYPTGPTF